MCRIRTFYECSDGTMGFAEMVMSYEDDIASFIKHWKCGIVESCLCCTADQLCQE